MRGNRQGNNAFIEDSVHVYQTPIEYLMNDAYCMDKIFIGDKTESKTLDVLKNHLGEQFEKFVNERALPSLMRLGC